MAKGQANRRSCLAFYDACMIEDMILRGVYPTSQKSYIRAVRNWELPRGRSRPEADVGQRNLLDRPFAAAYTPRPKSRGQHLGAAQCS